ncbi:hypothetical protein HPP92_007485 [Vanilla planifolia]|uniref:Uncharacterized protein n=1 Tax=Vanilla planifolia TaxID=51239 RepID=A0A835RRG5_VANPL|nr:hypothetical protein HPP92_007485 [Vanilla planifolia]
MKKPLMYETGDSEALRTIAHSERIIFPCGLPSLRFIIEDSDDRLKQEQINLLPKRTYQPSNIKRKRTHGYFARHSISQSQ